MRLSTLTMVRDAVLEGAGFSLLPDTLVGDDLADGSLVHVGDWTASTSTCRSCIRRGGSSAAGLRTFIDLLVETFPRGRSNFRRTRRAIAC